MSTPISLAALLERFFTQRLMQQRHASPHTISSYRDTFHQFLKFTEQRLRKEPSRLNFQEIDAPLITAFLRTKGTGRYQRVSRNPCPLMPSLFGCGILCM
jgi:site-specific recombinase XerD